MILLDADLFVIDLQKQTDSRFGRNRQAFVALAVCGQPLAVTAHVLLEVVGILSYGTPAAAVPTLPARFVKMYNLRVVPDLVATPEYAACTVAEVIQQMTFKMSLGDAVEAVQIRRFAPAATALLTWNAKHFVGRLAVPVMTPDEWLNQQPPVPTP